jgi:5,10-methylene-tetrahydrofolate dehydrogenase/methenyl tetrahydrofolate cyclohydrolase
MKRFLVILFVSVIALSQINCASNSNSSATKTNSPDASPATPITAAELIESYRMEAADGAGKYKGQTLAVTGTVSRVGKDYLNKLYVNLKADNPIIEVHCTYNEDQKDAMSALKAGEQVTIRGVCDGRLSTWVVLKDSVLQ